jgi:sugar phosphate isomerase/epimerase
VGICEFTTLGASFEDDLRAYAAAGADGIGICELKLEEGHDAEHLAAFSASGLAASACVPAVPSILPLPLLPGPEDPAERVEAIRASIRRLAPFEPAAVVCLTGPAGPIEPSRARAVLVEGLRAVAEEAARVGVPVGLEPMSAHFREDWTTITTLSEAIELADETGDGAVGVTLDTWHLWDSQGLVDDIAEHGGRVVAVHVSDWREPTRGWCDRALPGDGAIDLPAILAALDRAGWEGCYDIELFSDNGTFGNAYPDSLWNVEAGELSERSVRAFRAVWSETASRRPVGT